MSYNRAYIGKQLIYLLGLQLHWLNSTGILGREESKLGCYTIHSLSMLDSPFLPGLLYQSNMKSLKKEMDITKPTIKSTSGQESCSEHNKTQITQIN